MNQRTQQHQNGKGARYTKTHRPQRVAYVEILDSRSKAMKREREIKKLDHKKKSELISTQDKK